MKIAGNKDFSTKKWMCENKKTLIIAFMAILAVVAGLLVVKTIGGNEEIKSAQTSTARYEDNRDDEQAMDKVGSEEVNQSDDSENLVDGADSDENPGQIEIKSNSGSMVHSMINFTGIDTNADQLVDLVKQTINHANGHINENIALEVVGPHMFGALEAVKWTNGNGMDMNSGFADENGKKTAIQYADQPNDDLTYNNVAGSMGTDIFNDDPMGQFRTGDTMLMNMVINGIYSFDTNFKGDFWVDPSNNRKFVDGKESQWDVNFGVHFNYDSQSFKALIGNMNNEYIVLDILKGGETGSTIVNSAPPVDHGKEPSGLSGNMDNGSDGMDENVVIGGNSNNLEDDSGNGKEMSPEEWNASLPPLQPGVGGPMSEPVIEGGGQVPGLCM